MAIKNRQGKAQDFVPTKLLGGEFAVVQEGDESSADGSALYLATKTGSVKRIPFATEVEDLKTQVEEVVEDAEEAIGNAIDPTLKQSGKAADAKKTGDEIAELKSDLSDLQEEVDNFEGISEEVKQALLACFENVAWINKNGKHCYDLLYNALYSGESFDYVWESSSGFAPTGMTYKSIAFAVDNEYATINKPVLFAGFGDKEIEMELAVLSGGDTTAAINVADKYGNGCRLTFNNGHPALIATHDNYQEKMMPVNSVDISEFNKYSILLQNGRVIFKINDEIISTGVSFRSAYNGQPIISASNPIIYENYILSAKIKSIKYKNYGRVSNKKVLKYYKNKGIIIGEPGLTDNTKRITTDLIYFPSYLPLSIRVVGLTENSLQYIIKIIDANGNCWQYDGGAYTQAFQKPNYSTIPEPPSWINEEEDYESVTKKAISGEVWDYSALKYTNGTVRLLFADGQSSNNELNRAISGSVFVNGEEYVLEEGVYE